MLSELNTHARTRTHTHTHTHAHTHTHTHTPHRLEFLENLDIVAMFSSEGEKVSLSQSISTSAARGAVEKWLLQVQDVMAISLRDVIEQARDVSSFMFTCTYMDMFDCRSGVIYTCTNKNRVHAFNFQAGVHVCNYIHCVPVYSKLYAILCFIDVLPLCCHSPPPLVSNAGLCSGSSYPVGA